MLPDAAQRPLSPPARSLAQVALSLLRPRPAEWVLLGWLLMLGGWLLARGAPESYDVFPRTDVLLAAAAILALKLGLAYLRTPWPEGESRLAFVYPATAVLAVIPFGEIFFDELGHLPDRVPAVFSNGGMGASFMLALTFVVSRFAVALLPLAFWFALGLHLKRRGAASLGSVLLDDLSVVLEHVRQLGVPVLVILTYPLVGKVLMHPVFADKDWLMQAVDRALALGHDPSQALQAWISAPVSEWMALSYTFYAFLLPFTFAAVIASGPRGALGELGFAVSLAFAAGYAIYLLVPVQGPMFAEKFSVSLDFYYFGWVKEQLMDKFRVARDCFPSLHTAVSLVCLWQLRRHARAAFWLVLPLAASIPFACVYLRYHYVADVLAGALHATAVGWLTLRFADARRAQPAVP